MEAIDDEPRRKHIDAIYYNISRGHLSAAAGQIAQYRDKYGVTAQMDSWFRQVNALNELLVFVRSKAPKTRI